MTYYKYVDNLKPLYSGWNKFPSDENEETKKYKYKYMSFEIEMSKDLHQVNRQTYSILDWLGDCGGLLDALFFLGEMVAAPFSVHAIQSTLAQLLVRFMPSDNKEKQKVTHHKGSEVSEKEIEMKRRKFLDKYGNNLANDPKS